MSERTAIVVERHSHSYEVWESCAENCGVFHRLVATSERKGEATRVAAALHPPADSQEKRAE